eukprot:COSAG05_NODE_14152_length_406_cov_0.837134_2_plen_49_part_00
MLAGTRHLVHIDSGHILGHAKYFLAVNRDAALFVPVWLCRTYGWSGRN